MASIDSKTADLREVVRELDNTGDDGFEGLMAAVLTDITKTSFILAKSGSQHGKDGQSALNSGAVSFEGKLYDKKITKNDVVSKIGEIIANDKGDADLWVLGSTGTVRTQDRELIEALGKRGAIATLIVDWPTPGMPPLAALLAMATDVTASFLGLRTHKAEADIRDMLDDIRKAPQYADRVRELRVALEQPSIAPAYALKRNEAYLQSAFENTRAAKHVFGQALAPGDKNVPGVLARQALRQSLVKYVFAKPNGSSTAVLGADGNGKSWLFAQTWLNQTPKPLSVILVPDDIKIPVKAAGLEKLLISSLITQTGDSETDIARHRWRKHFDRWKQEKDPETPRLVVFMDGINQRESIDWGKVINSLNKLMADLGGKLVFSCRTPFFKARLKRHLLDPLETVEVSEWTNPELEKLLTMRGTAIASLQPQVVEFLRNPRIFAVAAELFDKGQIEGFTELSISRLLFEHIRMGTAPVAELITVDDFVKGVRRHADEIIQRLTDNKNIDLNVFERPSGTGEANQSINEQLAVISAGRFFEEVEGDATLYSLKDDSTPLALGLSLLSTANQARRNNLNITDALSKILDPISALDTTSEVLISALIAAVLSDDTSDDIIAPLAISFVNLQNPDEHRYEEFRALARQTPTAFLLALEGAVLAESNTANLSWLTESLFELRKEMTCWPAITTACKRWLSMYSPAPGRMIISQHSAGSDEYAEEYQKCKDKIDAKQAAFSKAEQEILNGLVLEERGDYGKLNAIAFQFLAGGPLVEFAEEFRNWCFVAAFNLSPYGPHNEFDDMLQFNRVDWALTREAMLKAAEPLRSPRISETGRWALVYILRATGASVDAKEALVIAEDLTKHRKRFPGWRLVEDYCATDPCDPNSVEPANLTTTAEKYAAFDVSQLKYGEWHTKDGLFFEHACIGLARFRPEVAIETMRRFAADVVARDSALFRSAVFFLENHTAALDDALADKFIDRANQIANESLAGEDKHRELFVASQYGLSISFPHLNGDDQLAALMAFPRVDSISLVVCDLMQSCDPAKYEAALEKAYADGDTVNEFRLMAFGEYTGTQISERAMTIVGALTTSSNALVRMCALGLVYHLNDPALLRVIVDSDWDASKLDSTSSRVEIFYGSEILVQAAEQGIITLTDCIERIALSSYPSLVHQIGKEAALAVSTRIDVALAKALALNVLAPLPYIEQRLDVENRRPYSYKIEDKSNSEGTSQDDFKRLFETTDVWYERQKRNRKALETFERDLNRAGAQLIIQAMTADLIGEIYTHDPAIVRKWHQTFISLNRNKLGKVHNLALLVAQVIAQEDQKGAVTLFERLVESHPYFCVTFGLAQIGLEARALWNAEDGEEVQKLRFKRLDLASNDHDLAVEVLAAIRAGKHNDLRKYVLDRRAKSEPAHVARALMVAGFSEGDAWALETLEAHKDDYGFLKTAYNSAKFALDRFLWSRHWAEQMHNATSETDLWRYAVLLTKIVDGRFQGAEIQNGQGNALVDRYGPTFNSLIRNRIKKWKSKREGKLFGMSVPDPKFLA